MASKPGEYGKTHRVARRKQHNRVTTVNPDDDQEEVVKENKHRPVSLPVVDWTKRPLPGDEKK